MFALASEVGRLCTEASVGGGPLRKGVLNKMPLVSVKAPKARAWLEKELPAVPMKTLAEAMRKRSRSGPATDEFCRRRPECALVCRVRETSLLLSVFA